MLFSQVAGQEEVKKRLIQSVNDNRVSHAQLFLGPEGSGNLALAIAYAQYLSCTGKSEVDSCGTCSSCVKYQKLVHPDLHFAYPIAKEGSKTKCVDFLPDWREAIIQNPYINLFEWYQHLGMENKQGFISVEEAGDILRKLSLKTYESEYKVLILWMPEKLRTEAANSLLKIIEEPPQKTLFILVAENQDQILTTILSRCQIQKIPKITDADLQSELKIRFGLNDESALKIVHLSNGNFNEALKHIDQHAENDNSEVFQTWMRLCYKKDLKAILSWVEDIAKIGRERQKNFLHYASHIVRECIMMNYGDINLVRTDGSEKQFIDKFRPFINSKNCFSMSENINEAAFHVERNANPKILFFDLSLKMCSLLSLR